MLPGEVFTSAVSTFRGSAFIYSRDCRQRPDAPGEGQTNRRAHQNAEAEAEAGGDPSVPVGAGKDDQWNSVRKGSQ